LNQLNAQLDNSNVEEVSLLHVITRAISSEGEQQYNTNVESTLTANVILPRNISSFPDSLVRLIFYSSIKMYWIIIFLYLYFLNNLLMFLFILVNRMVMYNTMLINVRHIKFKKKKGNKRHTKKKKLKDSDNLHLLYDIYIEDVTY
jgi:hypothetical protein